MTDEAGNFEGECYEMGILVALHFLRCSARKRGSIFLGHVDFHRNDGMVVLLLSFLCNYDNLTLKLHQEKRSYVIKDGFLLTDSKLKV